MGSSKHRPARRRPSRKTGTWSGWPPAAACTRAALVSVLSVLVAPSAVFYFHLSVIRSTSSRIRSLLQFASALSCESNP